MIKNVLISGAGIAGPTLAYWLARYGMTVTVVERAPQIRTVGQTIDIRGVGIDIIRKMGLEEIIRANTTGEEGMKFVNKDDRTKAAFPVDLMDGQGFVSEIEILRGQLATVLYDHTRNDVKYIFDDVITAINDRDDRVRVSFAKAKDCDYDAVLVADGLSSRTRKLVFGDDKSIINDLDQYVAHFSIPYEESDGTWSRWYNAPGRRFVFLRPDNRERRTTRTYLAICNAPNELEKLDVEHQKAEMRTLFADAGWEIPRVLPAMDQSSDFYVQKVAQVKMDTWSKGRVALVGDAGYCPSPISGMGTTVAIVGAYILAGEIARHGNCKDAFASYENVLRPFIAKAQTLPLGAPKIASPQTVWGIQVFHSVLRALSFSLRMGAGNVVKKFVTPPAESIRLPNYDK